MKKFFKLMLIIVICAFLSFSSVVILKIVDANKIIEELSLKEAPVEKMSLENNGGNFSYYAFLNDAEKEAYTMINEMVKNYRLETKINEISLEAVTRVFIAVRNDHPEYFWMGEFFSYSNDNKVSKVTGTYPYHEEEKNRRQEEIDQSLKAFDAGITETMDEYTKVKYAFDYVVKNTQYESNAEDQNMYSVLVDNASVCAGYAKAMQYLLERLGIETAYVTGNIPEQGAHAWNIVKVDGAYYYLDATWGEFEVEDSSEPEKNIRYDYFCVTTETVLKTHTIDESFIQYPILSAEAANYFSQEKLIFDLNNNAEQMRFELKLKEAMARQEKYFHYKELDQDRMDSAKKIIGNLLGEFYWYKDERAGITTVVLY